MNPAYSLHELLGNMRKGRFNSLQLNFKMILLNTCKTKFVPLAFASTIAFALAPFAASANTCAPLFKADHVSYAQSKRSKLRQFIERHGLAIVINRNAAGDLNSPELRREIYSEIPVYTVESGQLPLNIREVVFHGFRSSVAKISAPLAIGLSPETNGRAQTKIDDLKLARRIDPSVMPQTLLISELKVNHALIQSIRAEVRIAFEKKDFELLMLAFDRLSKHLTEISRQRFPSGAIFKLADDVKTGDEFGLLTSENLQILLERSNLKKTLDSYAYLGSISFEKFLDLLRGRRLYAQPVDRIFNLLADVLTDPNQVIAQERLALATVVDRPIEIRVDFVNGVAISAVSRYGYAYLPDVQNRAISFVNEFLFKAQHEFPNLNGGADIVLLSDGSLKVIEFNLGDRSGFRLPRANPIPANWFLSVLQGKPTRMLARFGQIAESPIAEQKRFLQNFQRKRLERFERESDIYVADVIAHFRDLAIDYHRLGHSDFPDRSSVVLYVSQLIKSIHSPNQSLQKDLDEIYKTTQAYFDRKEIK